MNEPSTSSSAPLALWSVTFLTRLYRYKALLKRRWWILALTISGALCYQSAQIATEPPNYQSTARMMVKIKVSLPEGSVYSEEFSNFFGTQMELMRCGEVQSRARVRLAAMRPDLVYVPVGVVTFLTPRTSIFVLSASGSEPAYTQAYLDACMDEYINLKKEMRSQTSECTLAAITEELAKLEKELRAGEEELFHFQKENNIGFLQEQGNSAASYMINLDSQMITLKADNQFIESLAAGPNMGRASQENRGSATNTFVPGDKVTNALGIAEPEGRRAMAKQQLQVLKADREEMLKKFKPEHPRIIKMEEEIAQTERMISLYELQGIEQLADQRKTNQLKIENLEKTIAEWEVKALDMNRRLAEYNRIKSKMARLQDMHGRLLSTMQSLGVNKNLDHEVLSIMEHAGKAVSVRAGVLQRILTGLLFGLLAGMGILALLDRIDDRVNSLTELRDNFKERVIGQIPLEPAARGATPDSLLLLNGARHIFSESFRNIRSSLFFMDIDGTRPKTLLITSASPGEGKSTAAGNLAITMTSAGSRTLLIDADLRRGTIHQLFGISPPKGLADILSQRIQWTDAVVACPSCPGLSIISRGSHTSNPGELFLSPATDVFFHAIRDLYDCIILDSAPVLAADDTASLAPKMDGVLFLMSASMTSSRLAQNSLDLLYHRRVKVLGLLFNRVDTSLPEYYYYQYHVYDISAGPVTVDGSAIANPITDKDGNLVEERLPFPERAVGHGGGYIT